MTEVTEFLRLYATNPFFKNLENALKQPASVQLKGLTGSLDAVLLATHFSENPSTCLVCLNDREDAAYFYNDLQYLLGDAQVLLFPMSYKRPYEYLDIDNANVLMRAEVLNTLVQGPAPCIIVTYPEALSEKVINKRSLIANTLHVKIGDNLSPDSLVEILHSYHFERTDFVYEAGQYSIRGGIIDVFSYAGELPVRIELFGNDVDSLRVFDPNTQLSSKSLDFVNIVPDVQSTLVQEKREPLSVFFQDQNTVWIKDIVFCVDAIENCLNRAKNDFENIVEKSNGVAIISKPEEIFDTPTDFKNWLLGAKTVEFGRQFFKQNTGLISYHSKPQPSFNKDFNRLVESLKELQEQRLATFVVSDSLKQLNRLSLIADEIDPEVTFRQMTVSLREGFVDTDTEVAVYTDHQIFDRFHKYKTKDKYSKTKALTLKELKTLQPGDYVTHVDYGIGRFVGLEKTQINGQEQEGLRLIYKDNDVLWVNIHSLHKIAKYSGKEGNSPTMNKLGGGDWDAKKQRVKKQVKDIAKELIALYAKRREAKGMAYSADTFMQAELESSFLYEDTPDQAKATTDVKNDMEQAYPMDRLVCGDVGFGKTEIAVRAAFKAVADSKQVAVLVPTTILAMQHTKTFKERLGRFPVNVAEISRFKTTKEINEVKTGLKEGNVDIVVGTHRILNKEFDFKDLGLMIIDEEQKFGVKAKERLKEMKLNVDVLTLTATPIPRTLHFSLMGARDLSVIATPPPNRQPVTTELHAFSEEFIRDAISFELRRGGQVFFVHNRVNDIDGISNIILRMVPDARLGVAHGQMEPDKLEAVMMKFIENQIDVLVSTNIIESGLDIPNANTIIINGAHMFGMSDLHQMRGRVGRSNKKAFCYLVTPPLAGLTKDARKRLQTLEEFSDLGDGFKVAMRDLDIRGAGNLLGSEQSGFINDLGYELYHKILDEAVQELKEQEFRNLFNISEDVLNFENNMPDCQIETDLSIMFPESYVSNITERLSLYNQLDSINNEAELKDFEKMLKDRFGRIPEEARNLFKIVQIRWMAQKAGFEKLTFKNNTIRGSFVSSDRQDFYVQSENFGRVLRYVSQNKNRCQLGEAKGRPNIVIKDVNGLEEFKSVIYALNEVELPLNA